MMSRKIMLRWLNIYITFISSTIATLVRLIPTEAHKGRRQKGCNFVCYLPQQVRGHKKL